MAYCKICGKPNCKKHTALVGRAISVQQFSGSSPPEIFVGRQNYPDIYTGILSPAEYGDTSILASPEKWHKSKLPIPYILNMRKKLIYARTRTSVKRAPLETKFLSTMQEVAMTQKPIAAEYKLKKPVIPHMERENRVPLISQAAPIKDVRLEENPTVKPKVDYLVNDTDVKSRIALLELEKSNIDNSTLIKLLSAGLLGIRKNRKLVPTRWAITAVDDTLSKEKLSRIRYNPEVSEFQIFSAEYLGNHYEFLLLPEKYSFEVIEIAEANDGVWHDHETFFPRTKYADSVTGAYYANRLALTEYLEKIKRQASCIVFREIRPEYYAPLGVGILRETSREAFSRPPIKFSTLKEALDNIQTRLHLPLAKYTEKSVILPNYGKQSRLSRFF